MFLVDVDNTLLDNDRIQEDSKEHLLRDFGPVCRDRYWAILERLFDELGYRDYLVLCSNIAWSIRMTCCCFRSLSSWSTIRLPSDCTPPPWKC